MSPEKAKKTADAADDELVSAFAAEAHKTDRDINAGNVDNPDEIALDLMSTAPPPPEPEKEKTKQKDNSDKPEEQEQQNKTENTDPNKESAPSAPPAIRVKSAEKKKYETDKTRRIPAIMLENEASLKKGATLGSYRIIKVINLSGLCEFYLAGNVLTKKLYALKLFPQLLSMEPDFPRRFNKTMKILKELYHQNIVNIHHYGEHRGFFYVVSDLIIWAKGRVLSLEDRLEHQGKMTEHQVKKIAKEICSALEYAKHSGPEPVIHSDLKPSNILFDSENKIKVSDFETIKIAGHDYFMSLIRYSLNESIKSPVTERPTWDETMLNETLPLKLGDRFYRKILGIKIPRRKRGITLLDAPSYTHEKSMREAVIDSYDYMSPEQKGLEEPTTQSNIYSLGLILYRMLTGRKMSGNWDLPSTFGCAKTWDDIIVRCLDPEPSKRFASFWDLNEAIEKIRPPRKIFAPVATVLSLLLITAISIFLIFTFATRENQEEEENGLFQENTASVDEELPLPKVPVRIVIKPAGAKTILSKNDQMLYKTLSFPSEGMRFHLKPGNYTLKITHEDYEPLKKNIAVEIENNKDIIIDLQAGIQKQIKKYVYLKNLRKPAFGYPWVVPNAEIEMLPMEPGTFSMGSDVNDPQHHFNEFPKEKVRIVKPFWISKTEITQMQYEEVMWSKPSIYLANWPSGPVDSVSWDNAIKFCRRITASEKAAGRLPRGYIYRLPTEAEWEYCCRAGSSTAFFYGNDSDLLGRYAWFYDNSERKPQITAKKKPNPWGLYDMLGNMAEWCINEEDIPYLMTHVKIRNDNDTFYIMRGGSWKTLPELTRSTSRAKVDSSDFSDGSMGMRIVLAPGKANAEFLEKKKDDDKYFFKIGQDSSSGNP